MSGGVGELLEAAAERIRGKLGIEADVDPGARWAVRGDPERLAQMMACLASRLRYELGAPRVSLSARSTERALLLELRWPGAPLQIETWKAWESQSLRLGGEPCALTPAAILERHGAEAWHRYDSARACGVIEIALPLDSGKPAPNGGKPQ